MSNYYFIFDKTEKGQAAQSAGNLKQPYRRFLTLINGKRSVAELETVARPNELEQTIDYLAAQGYIKKVRESSMPEFSGTNISNVFTQVALTEDMFIELQGRIIEEVREQFGESSEPLVERLETCSTPQDMRVCLRIAHTLIVGDADPVTLRMFAREIGGNLV